MSRRQADHPHERLELVRIAARLGAVTAQSLAVSEQRSVASARGRLLAAERAGLLARNRPLAREPALYVATAAGLRVAGLPGFEPARVSAANARHAIACAAAAGALACAYPGYVVSGERELRRDENAYGEALASARLPARAGWEREHLHRPDLVLWPRAGGLPVAVEVELTVKAPRRLLEICTAWSRCRCVAGVLYLASREARRPLERALREAHAGAQIALLDVAELLELAPTQ
jgi:hypothetical protein